MPGLLKRNAHCPKCGDPLLALVDTTQPSGNVTRELFHDRWPGASLKARRKRRCVQQFSDFDMAQRERNKLEVSRGKR